eukprot:7803233-Heterocapsa_arctica.AAC.1
MQAPGWAISSPVPALGCVGCWDGGCAPAWPSNGWPGRRSTAAGRHEARPIKFYDYLVVD